MTCEQSVTDIAQGKAAAVALEQPPNCIVK